MASEYFVGLRATDDLVSNEDPGAWRAGIMRLFPNGMAPLTGLTALLKSEAVPNAHFHWWDKELTSQRSVVTNIYTDSGMATAYVSGGVASDPLFVKIPVAGTSMFRAGQLVLLRDASNANIDCVAKVLAVAVNGANSKLSVLLLQDDDGDSANGNYLATADVVLVIGNSNPMGGTRPEAIAQAPVERENYTQIWRDSLDLARTLMKTKLRTENAYTESKRDALEQHSIGIEKSLIWGVLSSRIGENGKREYTTRGLMSWLRGTAAEIAAGDSGVVADYTTDTGADYSLKTWLAGGEQWLDERLESIFRFGSAERLAFCGSGVLLAIQRLVKNKANFNITAKTTLWGSNVREWVTPFGQITMKTHPLFSYEATNRNMMMLFEPRNLTWRTIDDTHFMPDVAYGKGGGTGYDGKQEEYLTEAGFEVHHPKTGGILTGFGTTNTTE
jgi:hypothetical protein